MSGEGTYRFPLLESLIKPPFTIQPHLSTFH